MRWKFEWTIKDDEDLIFGKHRGKDLYEQELRYEYKIGEDFNNFVAEGIHLG